MTERLDFVIYGATGFTGYYCVKVKIDIIYLKLFNLIVLEHSFKFNLSKFQNLVKINSEKNKNYSFAIAGRSVTKLKKVLEDVGKELNKDLSNVQIIEANADSKVSLVNMTKQAKGKCFSKFSLCFL